MTYTEACEIVYSNKATCAKDFYEARFTLDLMRYVESDKAGFSEGEKAGLIDEIVSHGAKFVNDQYSLIRGA